jgi:hypothetical protein
MKGGSRVGDVDLWVVLVPYRFYPSRREEISSKICMSGRSIVYSDWVSVEHIEMKETTKCSRPSAID